MNNENHLTDEQTIQVSGGTGSSEEVTCPACGSKNLKESFTLRTKSGMRLTTYKCLDCSNVFCVKYE
jgi:DNA-directed RNA polymerase subunit M/transcription elongation factor TFIIS